MPNEFVPLTAAEAEALIEVEATRSPVVARALPAGADAFDACLVCRSAWHGPRLTIPQRTLLIVMGDLRADEWVCSADTSYSSQTLSELIVMGDLVARDIVLTQEVTVDGDLHAERLLFADSDGDLTLRVRGEVRAAHLDTRGHQLEVGGRIQGEHRTCESLARALADARSAE